MILLGKVQELKITQEESKQTCTPVPLLSYNHPEFIMWFVKIQSTSDWSYKANEQEKALQNSWATLPKTRGI